MANRRKRGRQRTGASWRAFLAVPKTAAATEQQGFAVVDHSAVYAHPSDFAGKAAMFDLGAAIHDDGEAGPLCDLLRFCADHAQLHPKYPKAEPVLFRHRL